METHRYHSLMGTKTETINVKVTPHIKRLCLGAVVAEGHGSEANLIAECIRRYCKNAGISAMSEEAFQAHKAANVRKKKEE